LLKKYREIASVILDKYFKPEQLQLEIDQHYTLIKKDLANDPYPARRVTNPHDRGYDDIVLSMKKFMKRRYQLARQQLDNPGPKPQRRDQQLRRIHSKVKQVENGMKQWAEHGKNPNKIGQQMHQEFFPMMKAGNVQDAEKLIDRIMEQLRQGLKPLRPNNLPK